MLSREQQRSLRSRIFRHLDGLVTAPTAHALAERGVLRSLHSERATRVTELAREFDANDGYLNVALRVLASQGWLEHAITSADDVEYRLTETGRLAFEQLAPYGEVVDFMRFTAQFHTRRFEVEPFRHMERLYSRLRGRFDLPTARSEEELRVFEQILAHVEGALFGPTIVRLGMTGMFHKYFMEASFRPDEFHQDGDSFGRLLGMLAELGWFAEGNGTYRFTDEGLFFARRASAYGVTVSYLPTLRRLDELIFGDVDSVRSSAVGEAETHVDRETNVWGSGGAHAAYFRSLDAVVIELFNRPIEDQPRGVLDMGCGNGALLEHLFDVIENQTRRGEMLEDHPLFLVGIDYNKTALRVTRENLTRADIWAKVAWGDIGRPERLAEDLDSDYGIDLRDLLNVRTFLDHNRPWQRPESAGDGSGDSTGAFASRGERLCNRDVEDSLREHLRGWAPYLGRFGLVVIELHTLPPALSAANLGRTPVTAYDATHGYSDQYIVEMGVFEKVAAEAGLERTESCARRFPDSDLATVSVNLLRAASPKPT